MKRPLSWTFSLFFAALGAATLAGAAGCTCGPKDGDPGQAKVAKERKAGVPMRGSVIKSSRLAGKNETPKNHYGAPFVLGPAQRLSDVLVAAEANGADPTVPVKVRGRIESVCQRRGCWFTIRDRDKTARIVVKDHGFSIPGNTVGKVAVAEGLLDERTLSEEDARHLEEDRGGDPKTVVGERDEFVLTATSVRIKAPKKNRKKGKKKKGKKGKGKKNKKKANVIGPAQ